MAVSHRMGELAKLDAFVRRIENTCRSSPGGKADLRSGIGKPVVRARRMHKPVLSGPFPSGARPSEEQAYYTVAALIAAQPGGAFAQDLPDEPGEVENDGKPEASASTSTAERRNLGASLAFAVHHNKLRPNTAEARLHLLVRQSADGVHERLPGVVRHLLAGSPAVPVDWAQLLYDLRRWEFRRDEVAKEWLQTYYRTLRRVSGDTAPGDKNTTEDDDQIDESES